jgi:hypothetical protein
MPSPVWHTADQKTSLSTGASVTIDRPDNVAPGDLLQIILLTNHPMRDNTGELPGAGWTRAILKNQRNWSDLSTEATRPVAIVYSKIAGDSEPANYTWNFTGLNPGGTIRKYVLAGRMTNTYGMSPARSLIDFSRHTDEFLSNHTVAIRPTTQISNLPDAEYLNLFIAVSNNNTTPWTISEPSSGVEVLASFETGTNVTVAGIVAAVEFSGTSTPVIEAAHTDSTWMQIQLPYLSADYSQNFCPAQALFAGSGTAQPGSDFSPPERPVFESQKNITAVGHDVRTGVTLTQSGAMGMFGESPPTSVRINRSTDCGRTYTQIADLDEIVQLYGLPTFPSDDRDFSVPWAGMIPGLNPGEWLIFNAAGGYYFSADNGETWSERREALIGMEETLDGWDARFYGIPGVPFQYNTRHQGVSHSPNNEIVAFACTPNDAPDYEVTGYIAVRKGTLTNEGENWVDVMPPSHPITGPVSWYFASVMPVIGAGLNAWVMFTGFRESFGTYWDDDLGEYTSAPSRGVIIRNPSIDFSAPWDESGWVVSEEYCEDTYEGTFWYTDFSVPPGFARILRNEMRNFTHYPGASGRVKFLPLNDHPHGGRWWLLGTLDGLYYSDDNGVTWNNTLSDHKNPGVMHPFINWGASRYAGRFATPRQSKVMDMITDPNGSGRVVAVGTMMHHPGISNNLAVFACSSDGGNTWGPPGQLPIQPPATESTNVHDGWQSTSVARYIIPCFRRRQ